MSTHRTPGRSRLVLAATTTVLALTAPTACGEDGGGSAKGGAGTASPSGATDSPSQEASASAPQSAGEEISPDEFSALLRSAVDLATTSHISMDLGGSAGRAEGDTDYTTSPPSLAMTLTMAQLGGETEVRLVDGSVYVKSPAYGDKWLSFSLDDPNSPLGALGSQLDPTQQFEAYGAAVTSATYQGEEDVDGDTLEHYTTVVDTEKLLEQLPSAGVAGSQLPDSLQQEWWFDGDGRISRYSSDFGSGSEVEVAFTDWGEPVTIEAPPADEVTTMPGAPAA